MNAIEAYNASSTCVCGGIPHLVETDGKPQIQCATCGCAGPACDNAEQAVNHWNQSVEALTTKQSVTDIMCRDNPKMAELLGKGPVRDPAPVIDAARMCLNGLDCAWEHLINAIIEYDKA